MPNYRIGSFTRPGENIGAEPIIMYFAKLPRGGDISGDIGKVIAAVAFDLEQLEIQFDSDMLALWVTQFASMAGYYDTTRIDLSDAEFVSAKISNEFVETETLVFKTENEFTTAVNLVGRSFGGK